MKKRFRKLLSLPAIKKTAHFFLGKPGKPLYLTVAVHTEGIQDAAIFEKMAQFSRALPFKATAFVMTPLSPIIRAEMKKKGITEETFTAKLKSLGGLYEIGFHGHYCQPWSGASLSRETSTWLKSAGFERISDDPEALKKQFKTEYDYLAANVCKPKSYCAGWWVLNETIVRLLEKYGFDTDCSILHGGEDSFGGRYLTEDRLPGKGRAFILPPSKTVAEFLSVAYLNMNWWSLIRELFPMLAGVKDPLFAVLPVHDRALTVEGEKVLENIRLLFKIRNVKFVSLSRMRELAKDEELI